MHSTRNRPMPPYGLLESVPTTAQYKFPVAAESKHFPTIFRIRSA